MKKIIVLGAGMVGSTMALDMAKKHEVTIADVNESNLKKIKNRNSEIKTKQINVKDIKLLKQTLNPFDLVICAVPGFLGYNTLKSIIEAKKNVIDISFFPENSLQLNKLAIKNNVTVIVDCGVAPGMDNIILGYYNEQIKVTDFECLVGGLPKYKKWPFCYKAPFSPIDVIEEYTRPARYIENNKLIVKEALTDVEHIEFEGVGTLEAFNSDGLRTLIDTMPHIANMKEKTLRYPGHVEYIKVLKESGFFNEDKIEINGQFFSPLELSSKILFKEWYLSPTDEELTVMRVTIKGITAKNEKVEISYHLFDEYDTETQISSMARTTGYTATAAANMFLDGLFSEKGVFPPELVGKHQQCFEYIINYLEQRNIIYTKKIKLLEASS